LIVACSYRTSPLHCPPSTLLIVMFPPPPIVSIINQIEVKRGGWLLHLPAQSPITSCIKAQHLQWSSPALVPQPRLFVDPSIISTAVASMEAKVMCFWSDWSTNSRGREVELKELTIN
jgi:hypothetical protein